MSKHRADVPVDSFSKSYVSPAGAKHRSLIEGDTVYLHTNRKHPIDGHFRRVLTFAKVKSSREAAGWVWIKDEFGANHVRLASGLTFVQSATDSYTLQSA